MPHFPKPFFRKDRNLWYVQVDGKQHNLGSDREAAFRKYHELMQRPPEIRSELVAGVIDGFLDWCQRHRAARTYDGHQWHLQRFLNSLPNAESMSVADLKPFHVMNWVDSHPQWGRTYRRNAITSVQRAFRWAHKVGHIDSNPVAQIEKPTAARREQIISEVEYGKITGAIKDRAFRELIEFSWETGARPQETKRVEARHFNKETQQLELAPAESKGGKRWRIILLTGRALEIIRRLAKDRPNGRLFLNRCGRPWTTYAVKCRFARLESRLGVRYSLYAFRHSFATRMLTKGVDSLSVSALLGHADGTMLARVYSHLDKSTDYLRQVLTNVTAAARDATSNGVAKA